MPKPSDADIAAVLLDLAAERGLDRSFCPSEAARRLSADWRPLVADVRRVAGSLPLQATQKGVLVDLLTAKGPIRLARKP